MAGSSEIKRTTSLSSLLSRVTRNGESESSDERSESNAASPASNKRKRKSLFGIVVNRNGDSHDAEDLDHEHEDVDENDGDHDDEDDDAARDGSGGDAESEVVDEEFENQEREYDALLPEDMRKFRPRGYKFNPPPKDRPIRVYADGVFDLFHLGHMKQLEQAKKALPNATLVVGIPSDEDTHSKKGLTVLTDKQRAETLRHCKWVDEVIENCPWQVTPDFMEEHNLDYVAHDDLPYASAGADDIYKPMKENGMFLTTQRTDGISTSDIITRIIRDYDKYLMRNFARGATRKELNVSWMKKNEIDLKRHVAEFRDSFKNNFETASRNSDILGFVSWALKQRNAKNKRPRTAAAASASADDENEGMRSPVSDFAAKFTDGSAQATVGPSSSSFFDNVRGWVSRKIDGMESPFTPSVSGTPVGSDDDEEDQEKEDVEEEVHTRTRAKRQKV